jgi:hypothetical protein
MAYLSFFCSGIGLRLRGRRGRGGRRGGVEKGGNQRNKLRNIATIQVKMIRI